MAFTSCPAMMIENGQMYYCECEFNHSGMHVATQNIDWWTMDQVCWLTEEETTEVGEYNIG